MLSTAVLVQSAAGQGSGVIEEVDGCHRRKAFLTSFIVNSADTVPTPPAAQEQTKGSKMPVKLFLTISAAVTQRDRGKLRRSPCDAWEVLGL